MFRKRYFRRRTLGLNHKREIDPVPILRAGAIWVEELYEGRVLPALGLDTSRRPDIAELIAIHQGGPPGDIEAAWGRDPNEQLVTLRISFERPAKLTMFLDFPLDAYALVVDHMVDARAFYIQVGSTTSKLSDNPNADRVVVGLPDTGFRPHWRKILEKYLRSIYRQKGLSRADSKDATMAYLRAWDIAKRNHETLNEFLDRHT
jgi:hypothetical protein